MSHSKILWDYKQPDYFHFAEDSLELARFALENYQFEVGDKVLDLCAGCGVVGLELYQGSLSKFNLSFCELQKESVSFLQKNLDSLELDFPIFQKCFTKMVGKYSVLLANPPFFDPNEGRLSPCMQKNISRHYITGSLEELFQTANSLQGDDGVFFVSGPLIKKQAYEKVSIENNYRLKKIRILNKVFVAKFSRPS